MSGTVARSLGALGDALGGTANVNFDANTLFIDGINNRVGIGTSSPGAELEVRDIAGDNDVRINLRPNVSTLSQVGASSTQTFIDSNGDRPFIFYINSSERMRVDGSGRITKPGQPAFYAFRSDGSYTPGASTLIPWNNTSYNIGNHFNTSTGRFTAPVAGLYFFHYQQYFRGNYTARHFIARNGGLAGLMHLGRNNTGTEWTHSLALILNCAANDIIDCRTDTATGELFTAVDHSWFMGFLIG